MRITSREAYEQLEDFLSERQMLAWTTLGANWPMTAQELETFTGKRGIWKRLSELRSLGLVVEEGTRKCAVTGRNAIIWRAIMVPSMDAPLQKASS